MIGHRDLVAFLPPTRCPTSRISRKLTEFVNFTTPNKKVRAPTMQPRRTASGGRFGENSIVNPSATSPGSTRGMVDNAAPPPI